MASTFPTSQDAASVSNNNPSIDENTVRPPDLLIVDATTAAAARPIPKLSTSLHERYFTNSAFPKAFEVERDQPFDKNNVNQSYTADKQDVPSYHLHSFKIQTPDAEKT